MQDRCAGHRADGRDFSLDIRQLRFTRAFTKREAHAIEQTIQNYYGRRVTTLKENLDTKNIPKQYGPLENIKDELPVKSNRSAYCKGIELGDIMIRDHGGTSRERHPYGKYRRPSYPRRQCG